MSMSAPLLQSVSFSYTATYGRPSAATPATAPATAPASAPANDAQGCDAGPRVGHGMRPHRLMEALMQALGSLVGSAGQSSATTAATATPSATATTSSGSTTPADTATATGTTATTAPATTPATTGAANDATGTGASLREVAVSFAHALFQALRGGEGEHARGHHHHHGHREGGYGGMADRLDALAQRLGAGSGATAPTETAGTSDATDASFSATLSATASSQGGDVSASFSLQITWTTGAGAVPADGAQTADSTADDGLGGLRNAFAQLYQALNGGQQPDTNIRSLGQQLATFLQTLASGLRGGTDDSQPDVQPMPRCGSLLSIAA